jgi:adenylosuccinate synthase
MTHYSFVGLQFGDEGKGKAFTTLIDMINNFMERVDLTIKDNKILTHRHQGGGNAGHTGVVDKVEYKLHQIPTGVIMRNTYNLMGFGMFINPRKAMAEIKQLREKDLLVTPKKLGICSKAHMTLDFHVASDQAAFNKKDHTSTGNGIKETAIDKYGRQGLRFVEFLDPNAMGRILTKRFGENVPDGRRIKEFVDSYNLERLFFAPFLTSEQQAFENRDFIVGEGAQGVLLDVGSGLYPGVTSSHPANLPHHPDKVIGVFKSYVSSVGKDRPFVSKIGGDLEEELRQEWGEFGTTTGKPRDLGWLDVVALKYAVKESGTDYMIATCGDRLEALAEREEKVKVVVAYEIDGQRYEEWQPSFDNRETLYKAKPVFEEFEPWDQFVVHGEIHPNAKKVYDFIEEKTEVPICMISTGPAEKDVIVYQNIF